VVLIHQLIFSLDVIRILRNAVHRADLDALRSIIMTHTLGALGRIDLINFVTGGNRLVRALRFANVAIDTFVSDD